jgi:2-dehydropantoate 2-reductase
MTAVVGVLGPGAVGGMLAVRGALSGARVICVAPATTAAAVARDGLVLESAGETSSARPEAVERLAEPVDLLLVTVKAFALAEALERIDATAVSNGVVLPLLNGLEHCELVRDRIGGRVVAGSIGRLEAYRRDTTVIVQQTPAPLVSIAVVGLPPETLTPAFDFLRAAGVDVHPGGTEKDVLWEKAARLAPLAALTSTTQRPVGKLRTDPALRARLQAAVEEACGVAEADGAVVSAAQQWEIIEAMPFALTTSTARDVAAGRPTEADAIVGSVVRAGERLGVPTRTLAALAAELEVR